jgi:hypothetical protein
VFLFGETSLLRSEFTKLNSNFQVLKFNEAKTVDEIIRNDHLPPTSVSFLTSEKIHVHFVTNFLNALVPCDEPSG